jgi:hypothetical protein
MTRIVIAGDSWGAHSYEADYNYPKLPGFKWKKKKKYVLYPGPGHFLSELAGLETIVTADHGVCNSEAIDNLNKIDYKNDIIVFYKTGVLREISRAYMNKKDFNTTKDCKKDIEYYLDKFYKQVSKIKAKHFCLVGGCTAIDINRAKEYNIDVIEPSLTTFLFPQFNDSHEFDNIHYWNEFNYKDDSYFKKGVIQSGDKVEFWNKHPKQFCKRHPTVASNKKIAKRIYNYLKDKNIL